MRLCYFSIFLPHILINHLVFRSYIDLSIHTQLVTLSLHAGDHPLHHFLLSQVVSHPLRKITFTVDAFRLEDWVAAKDNTADNFLVTNFSNIEVEVIHRIKSQEVTLTLAKNQDDVLALAVPQIFPKLSERSSFRVLRAEEMTVRDYDFSPYVFCVH